MPKTAAKLPAKTAPLGAAQAAQEVARGEVSRLTAAINALKRTGPDVDQTELADRVKHKRALGFSDVRATENPNPRTTKFFERDLPRIADRAARQFRANEQALWDYIGEEINLAQLYNAVGSPAAGNWIEPEDSRPDDFV